MAMAKPNEDTKTNHSDSDSDNDMDDEFKGGLSVLTASKVVELTHEDIMKWMGPQYTPAKVVLPSDYKKVTSTDGKRMNNAQYLIPSVKSINGFVWGRVRSSDFALVAHGQSATLVKALHERRRDMVYLIERSLYVHEVNRDQFKRYRITQFEPYFGVAPKADDNICGDTLLVLGGAHTKLTDEELIEIARRLEYAACTTKAQKAKTPVHQWFIQPATSITTIKQ